MNDMQVTTAPHTEPPRHACTRGVAIGVAIGIVIGASLTFALTRPMGDVVRTLRDRMHGEVREPQFELLN